MTEDDKWLNVTNSAKFITDADGNEYEITHKATKLDIFNYISTVLEVVEKNGTKTDCIKTLCKNHPINTRQANEYYKKAMLQLEEDLNDDVKSVRNKRIKSLEKDVKEAYNNYYLAEKEADKATWYKIYLDTKKMLDTYYPNGLKPEPLSTDLNINLNYSPTRNSNE